MTSVVRRREHQDSGDYSDASQDIEHNNSGNDGQQETDYDSAASESEHTDQDAENKEAERRVDDDEDRSNPQYIPKRGTFYEHDDRTAASGEESSRDVTSETASEKKEGSEAGTERRRPPRKSDIVNKWSHDKYNENEQMPKSRDELVAIYGYDIRNEDAPPHARRNRRYGRGPNKYTRTWEDEEAYRRQAAALPQRKPPGPEDFPELEPSRHRQPRTPRPRSKSQPAVNEPIENGQLRRNASIKTAKKPVVKQGTGRAAVKAKPREMNAKDKDKLPAIENLTITASVNDNQGQAVRKVNATVAQQRPVPTDQAKKKPVVQPQQPNPPRTKSPQQQQTQQKPQQQPQTTPNQQPAAGGGSKRYSSLRQRPLADTYTPQAQQQPQTTQQQQHRQYTGPNEFVGSGHPPNASTLPHPQHIIHQQVRVPAAAHAASPPQPHAQQPVRLIEQPAMPVQHPHHSIHNMPQPHNIAAVSPAQLQQPQGYAPPAMMPAQYMQQSSGAGVYSAGMFPAAAPPQYQHAQIYPHHNFIQQQQNLQATQAGGVTYYNCAEQDHQPRTQRRPTAAIPIVSPHHSERPANSSEKDNIDRIVENMFVRKPWPAHGSDSKEKPDRSSQEPTSKDSSQPNSLTSSSISTDSKQESIEKKEEKEQKEESIEA